MTVGHTQAPPFHVEPWFWTSDLDAPIVGGLDAQGPVPLDTLLEWQAEAASLRSCTTR